MVAVHEGLPPSLALYTVAAAAVFESDAYLRTRGMGPRQTMIDRRCYRRNLLDGLDAAPGVRERAEARPEGLGGRG